MRRYIFKPILLPVISYFEASNLLALISDRREGIHTIKINAGLCNIEVSVESEYVRLPGNYIVNKSQLERMLRYKNSAFLIKNDVFKIEIRSKYKYYKLMVPRENCPPTLEISGIHMHRIVDTDPWRDSMSKVKLARIRSGMNVLDVCTGLGYTAIHSRLRGANYVLTIEKDPYVLEIAKANPWSRRLADPQIDIILDDATQVIPELESESFHAIIHDPPRFSLAGELYSFEFYQELYRVLKKGGILFHYTGTPGSKYRRMSFMKGVAQRLRKAGFTVVYAKKALGILGIK